MKEHDVGAALHHRDADTARMREEAHNRTDGLRDDPEHPVIGGTGGIAAGEARWSDERQVLKAPQRDLPVADLVGVNPEGVGQPKRPVKHQVAEEHAQADAVTGAPTLPRLLHARAS